MKLITQTRPSNNILFVHSPRSVSSRGLFLNSTHVMVPGLSVTSNNDMPVAHDDAVPTLPVRAYHTIKATKIKAAT